MGRERKHVEWPEGLPTAVSPGIDSGVVLTQDGERLIGCRVWVVAAPGTEPQSVMLVMEPEAARNTLAALTKTMADYDGGHMPKMSGDRSAE